MTVHPERGGRRGVALVGLRAAGKTTLGEALAARCEWPLIDTDRVLAERVGQPAGAYLAQVGEERFRAAELAVCVEALAVPEARCVVSLGGGSVVLPEVRARLMLDEWLTVWVDAADGVLEARRSTGRVDRPLLGARTVAEEIRRLRSERDALYTEVSDLRVETDLANVDACTVRVLAMM